MFKRVSMILLSLCIIISCTACKSFSINNSSTYESIFEYTETQSEAIQSTVTSNTIPSSTPSKTESTVSKPPSTVSKANQNKPTVKEKVNTDIEIEQTQVGKIAEINHTFGNHKKINEEDYYQLQSLDGNKKSLYLKFAEAVKNTHNIVNILKLDLKQDDVIEVYTKFLADHPQYFFISKNYLVIFNSKGDRIRAVVMLYTDGETTDDFDDEMNITTVASRSLINQKIYELQSATEQIINSIPDDISDAFKEKMLHDYVVNLVKYDYSAVDYNEYWTILNIHAYDIYGALIKKLAVCEGYTKLFQFLCYNVGINCTQVFGEAENSLHVWNIVQIENEWYHTDLTWADADGYICYSFYNLTTEQISKDHKITNDDLVMPECTSTQNSFMNLFVIYVEDTRLSPKDYKTPIDNIRLTNGKELYIYVKNYRSYNGKVLINKYTSYIHEHFSTGTEIARYLRTIGLRLSNQFYANNEYITLKLK